MTDIIFSFDTEDFTSNRAADGILMEAEILREAGIKGGFVVVGLVAQQLINWGRRDVIEALSHHELGLHSYGHSLHPIINEYTDMEDFEAAREEFLRQETKTIYLMKQAFGTDNFTASCPPGNQHSYVSLYGYSDLGIPLFVDSPADTSDGRGSFYCNMYHIAYNVCMEEIFISGGEKEIREMIDSLAERDHAVIYTHPHMSYFQRHWDGLNFYKKNHYPFGQWAEETMRTPEETQKFFDNLKLTIDLIKNDKRFRITTYSEIAKSLASEYDRTVYPEIIPEIRRQIAEAFYPTTLPMSLSLADIFNACRDFLKGKPHHTCGKVYGFLTNPYAITEPVTVHAENMIESAKNLPEGGFLPPEITVGDTVLGPGDWIRAALGILCGEKTVTLVPDVQLPSLDKLPGIRDLDYASGWRWMASDDFEDKYLSERMRLQSWTMRFRRGSCRLY